MIERKPCPCCGEFKGDPAFYKLLDEVAAKLPLTVSSGYRCGAYNARVSKRSTGKHTEGKAVDLIARTAAERGALMVALVEAGLISMAILPGGAGLHVDTGGVPWLGIE